MIKSSAKATFNYNIEKIWNIVTNNKEYSWRSDLSKIDIIDDNNFIEYTKDGFPTDFRIIKKEYLKTYEFNLVNKNLKGHWSGIFKKIDEEITQIYFIVEVDVNNFLIRLLAKPYLIKQQSRYIKDLRKKLEKCD